LGRPSRLGSEPKVGRPGIEGTLGSVLVEGRLGSEPRDGRPGSDPVEGRPGIEGTLGSVLAEGRLGSEPVDGRLGADPPDPPEVDGSVGTAGRLGTPEGGVTQIWRPLVLEAWTETSPPGEVALPSPAAVTGTGRAGVDGVATHCFPVGSDVGRVGGVARRDEMLGIDETLGSAGRPGTDGTLGTDKADRGLWLAPLGNTLAAPIAMAATPAAPPVSRMIRP
jgi:collagen type IV alpha